MQVSASQYFGLFTLLAGCVWFLGCIHDELRAIKKALSSTGLKDG